MSDFMLYATIAFFMSVILSVVYVGIIKGGRQVKAKESIKDKDDMQLCIYLMVCPAGQYQSKSWISLGFAILKHRMWHLFKHGKWMD